MDLSRTVFNSLITLLVLVDNDPMFSWMVYKARLILSIDSVCIESFRNNVNSVNDNSFILFFIGMMNNVVHKMIADINKTTININAMMITSFTFESIEITS